MRLSRLWLATTGLALFAGAASANDELSNLSKDPNQWVMPSGDYANTTELGKPVGKDSSIKSWQGDQWKIGGGDTGATTGVRPRRPARTR